MDFSRQILTSQVDSRTVRVKIFSGKSSSVLNYGWILVNSISHGWNLKGPPMYRKTDGQTDSYFIDRKKVNPDLFVIEIREICTSIYNIGNLLKSYDNIHSMTYITKIMLTGIAIKKHWILR